jgi:HNH endonuclease
MAAILLRNTGRYAIVDDADFERLNQWGWAESPSGYVWRSVTVGPNKQGKVRMHRLVASTPTGLFTDHVNGDKLDNRRENLRVCTTAENGRNRGANRKSSSRYKGVSLRRSTGMWRASICLNGRSRHIGSFPSQEEAARAYNSAAAKHYGEFARQNVISALAA